MSEQDQKAFKMYGKVPGKNLLTKMQKVRRCRRHSLHVPSRCPAIIILVACNGCPADAQPQ
jgi:hypothetical protein